MQRTLTIPETLCTHASALVADYRRRFDGAELDDVLVLAIDEGLARLATKQGIPPKLISIVQRRRSHGASR